MADGKLSLLPESRREKTTVMTSERDASTDVKNSIVVYQHLASDYKSYKT